MTIKKCLSLAAAGFCCATSAFPHDTSDETVVVTGLVTDRNGAPIAKCDVLFNKETFIDDNSHKAQCDKNGRYEITIPKGHYNSIYIINLDHYAKTKLEFWGWNMTFHEDSTLNAAYDKLEVYNLSVWNSNSPTDFIYASFRPMSLERVEFPGIEQRVIDGDVPATIFDITPSIDRGSITASIDDVEVAVKNMQWFYESATCSGLGVEPNEAGCFMPHVIAQLHRPELKAGRHVVRIRVVDNDTGAMGEAVTQFVNNEAGYGF